MMKINTESIAIDEPKNPDNCNVFKIFSLVANEKDISILKKRYASGSVWFGEVKKILLNVIKNKFKVERDKFNLLVNNPELVEKELKAGSRKARNFANNVLNRVRLKLGYNK